MTDIYSFLDDNGITYERFDHPAVFTCEEAEKLCPKMPGVSVKNLFLRDKNGKRHFYVAIPTDKNIDLAMLKDALGVSKLSFGSPDRLQKYLGLTPGSVTLLGLMNDRDKAVEVVIDETLWGKTMQCHPLVNTATLAISAEGIEQFLKVTGHKYVLITIPSR